MNFTLKKSSQKMELFNKVDLEIGLIEYWPSYKWGSVLRIKVNLTFYTIVNVPPAPAVRTSLVVAVVSIPVNLISASLTPSVSVPSETKM